LLLIAVAGSIPFTAEVFGPILMASGGTLSASERCEFNPRGGGRLTSWHVNFPRERIVRRLTAETSERFRAPRSCDRPHQTHVTRRHVLRTRHEQESVIDTDVTLENLDLHLCTDRLYELAERDVDLASQQLLAVLRDPNQVELDAGPGMGGPSVVLHY
jgi:hypothetical protein